MRVCTWIPLGTSEAASQDFRPSFFVTFWSPTLVYPVRWTPWLVHPSQHGSWYVYFEIFQETSNARLTWRIWWQTPNTSFLMYTHDKIHTCMQSQLLACDCGMQEGWFLLTRRLEHEITVENLINVTLKKLWVTCKEFVVELEKKYAWEYWNLEYNASYFAWSFQSSLMERLLKQIEFERESQSDEWCTSGLECATPAQHFDGKTLETNRIWKRVTKRWMMHQWFGVCDSCPLPNARFCCARTQYREFVHLLKHCSSLELPRIQRTSASCIAGKPTHAGLNPSRSVPCCKIHG
jgi:hypothetical protein